MLDTSICVALLRGRAERVAARMETHDIREIAISSVTFAELQYGRAKATRPGRQMAALVRFVAPLAIVPFESAAARSYGLVRSDLERRGTPIGPLDTLIAAHAHALNLILVTNNEREFSRINGLLVEDWLRS
ncbi:MAG: type II toxin-antitoxin system VapC family toxin [Planctomycetes bacterium]|nr:type II toxin-antitoxin system VapC family toxin [Planctomycetota bacterium]